MALKVAVLIWVWKEREALMASSGAATGSSWSSSASTSGAGSTWPLSSSSRVDRSTVSQFLHNPFLISPFLNSFPRSQWVRRGEVMIVMIILTIMVLVGRGWAEGRRRSWWRRTRLWRTSRPMTWYHGGRAAHRSSCGSRRSSPGICFLLISSTTISPASFASSTPMYVFSVLIMSIHAISYSVHLEPGFGRLGGSSDCHPGNLSSTCSLLTRPKGFLLPPKFFFCPSKC